MFIKPSFQVVDSGSEIRLKCNVKGHPIAKIKWMFNGKTIDDTTGIFLGTDGTLKISSAIRENEGMYQCFVSNDWEENQSTAQIILGGMHLKLCMLLSN